MPLVERRYAQALFELSGADIHGMVHELKDFVEVFKTSEELNTFLLDPRVKTDEKQKVLRNVLTDKLSKNILNFILLLVDKHRIKELPGIYEQFLHIVNEKSNILEMEIISAVPLDEETLQRIKEKFRQKYKASSVKATEKVDSSIIGGVKVIIGDKVFDGSIKGRIESLIELVGQ